MKLKALAVIGLAVGIPLVNACATKKYVRNRVNERSVPLENRMGELEETSRRNTQDINRITKDLDEVRGRVDRVQQLADRAAASAEQANTRITTVEQSVTDLRSNLDRYSLQKTVSVWFKVGKADLMPEALETLDSLAGEIRDRNGFVLEIEGFASSDGATELNDRLSQARSESVRRYFAERHNIPLFRMFMVGFGENRPKADNSTREGREQNRRVEVRLLTNEAAGR